MRELQDLDPNKISMEQQLDTLNGKMNRSQTTLAAINTTDSKMINTLQSLLDCCEKIHRQITERDSSQQQTGITLVEVLERLDAAIFSLGNGQNNYGYYVNKYTYSVILREYKNRVVASILAYYLSVKKRFLNYVDNASKTATFLFWNPGLLLPLLACIYQLVNLFVDSSIRYNELLKEGTGYPAIELLLEVIFQCWRTLLDDYVGAGHDFVRHAAGQFVEGCAGLLVVFIGAMCLIAYVQYIFSILSGPSSTTSPICKAMYCE
ncbi:hypothetical protein QFC21_000173 [Naganishia friedmannii]|uniref:Uncharacterized protein n=1 Tax=Naganishia friedmannii TaxID=89922 RepID=A0ACC2WBL2_9TREE|nr:hypothetical protein QFC21_000173 [Naganishia friedmannii]